MMTRPIAVDKVLWIKTGHGIAAEGRIPHEAEFFGDHFPGFPVLPGVLALEMMKQTAELYLRSTGESPVRVRLKTIRGVKFTHYLKPGDPWQSHLEFISRDGRETIWKGSLRSGERVAVTARLVLEQLPAVQQLEAASI